MFTPGAMIAGRYRLDERLASGGMGDVWSAHDSALDRAVAIKLVKPELADDEVFEKRLVAEARAAAAVAGPHVVEIYDVGEGATATGRPVPYIAMAYVPGEPLSVAIARGPMPPSEVADVLSQVAAALAAAHARGVVHRDIKPANLMRSEAGHITVLDFGIARAASAASLTTAGQLIGTARYMSPEQVAGQPATAASDIYSLGVVGYQCLTGTPPFDRGSDVATALAHRDEPAPPLPETVPPGIAALVESCLTKDPSDRPSADEVVLLASSYLPAASAGDATAVMPMPAPAAASSSRASGVPIWLESRRVWAATAGLVVVIALITVIAIATGGPSPATAANHAKSDRNTTSPRQPRTVVIHAGHYVGEPYSLAAQQLTRKGLTPIAAGTGVSPDAAVMSVTPTGTVRPGSPVTLVLAPAPVSHPKPSNPKPRKAPKPGKVPPGQAKKQDGPGGKVH